MTDSAEPLDFLARGGEMGVRMRGFDWSITDLGSPQSWPQSLRTTVRMMLDSRFAMWMAWGPSLAFFCNDAYLPTLGLKRVWALGARADHVWAEIWHDIGPRIDRVLTTGEATWDEGLRLFLQRSGYEEETFHTFSYSPVYDEANRITGMLCVVVEETDRVLGERRLSLLRELASLSVAAVAGLDDAGRVLLGHLSERRFDVPFAALYLADGRTAEVTLAGATDGGAADGPATWGADARLVGPAMATQQTQLLELMGSERGVSGPWPEPIRRAFAVPLNRAGRESPMGCVLLGVSTRRELDDAYRSFLGLVADQFAAKLSDVQARLEAQRRADALAELDRAKNIFFSNVSHELRTPLTLLLGPVNDLLASGDLDPRARQALELAQRNGGRLRRLVNSLLDFSRIEAGRAETRFLPTDLALYTSDLAALFRSAIEGAGLRLKVDVDTTLPPVYVDRDMWEKVVLNLVSNAFKFTFDGEIEVTLSRSGETVQLRVRDTGVGIDEADLPRLFERFQRISGARSRVAEGTGIGLALVRELVKLHGGSVAAQSRPGLGSTFTVSVPLGHAHLPSGRLADTTELQPARRALDASVDNVFGSANSAIHSATAAPSGGAENGAHASDELILLVDDNADMREYLARLLAPFWRVERASDGVEALAALRAQRPDLVVTDMMMPNMGGADLIRHLRAETRDAYLPVIVLSARAGDEARVAGLSQGADDYLVKPFSTAELIARVEVQLMRGRVRRAEEATNKRLADLFRDAPVGVALLRGPEHVYEFANAVYQAFVPGRPLLGLAVRDALPEVVEQGIIELLDQVYRTGQPYKANAFAIELAEATGGPRARRFFEFIYHPLAAASGEQRGIAVIAVDVTQLNEARVAAEEASRAKDEFMAVLGHELRNPLAPISSALQLMKRRAGHVVVQEREVIERQVAHMVRLVDDLMDIARITRGNLELRRESVELAHIVDKAVETAGPMFHAKAQALAVEVARHGLRVFGDPTRLCQVVANLLVNASKFTSSQGRVTVHASAQDADAVLTVSDTGIGLTAEELDTVFGPFVQGRQDLHRPQGGLGLGLAIARNLVRLHGGTLTARSAGRQLGSEFTLRLPLLRSDVPAGDVPSLAAGPAASGQRILVVDDNVDAGNAIAELLRCCGHEVILAVDGPSALRAAEATAAIDAAVLDIGLPGMNGYELGQRLRSLDAGRNARLIALTGFGQPSDQSRTREHGFDAHLVKPVSLEDLLAALDAGTGS